MKLEETIIRQVHDLPETEKAEVLDFIKYLKVKIEKKQLKDWSNFSLSSAMN